MAFCLLIFASVLFCSGAQASFCWAADGEQCSHSGSEVYEITDIEIDKGIANEGGKSDSFRFRVQCDNTAQDPCNKQVQISLITVSYGNNPVDFSQGDYFDLGFYAKDGSTPVNPDKDKWGLGQPVSGVTINDIIESNENGFSNELFLSFRMTDAMRQKLIPGEYKFYFTLGGRIEGENWKRLEYLFKIDIPDKVQITGLTNIDLGTFPNHIATDTRPFCVYSTSGKFFIKASSGNGNSEFFLKSNDQNIHNKINYHSAVAQGIDSGVGDFRTMNAETAGYEFSGSTDKKCSDGKKMTLKVGLNQGFTYLSQLPAGTYTDTLTLTVSAQ